MTKYHHIITKYHHIMTKYHHIMTKYHHIMTKYHHIMKHLIIRQLWRSIPIPPRFIKWGLLLFCESSVAFCFDYQFWVKVEIVNYLIRSLVYDKCHILYVYYCMRFVKCKLNPSKTLVRTSYYQNKSSVYTLVDTSRQTKLTLYAALSLKRNLQAL